MNTNPEEGQATEWPKKSTGYGPTLILDVDNGIDFTFDGMGLKGNRPKKVESSIEENEETASE